MKLKFFAALLLLVLGNSIASFAQTCSVNAGVDHTICEASVMSLSGNSTGAFTVAAKWQFVSGPNVPVITSPSSALTTVTGFIAGNYVFRYYATCSDAAIAADSITITVDPKPIFSAGNDTFVCGNSATLNATLPVGAAGLWGSSIVSNVSNPVFSSPTSKTSNVSVSSGVACPQQLNVIWRVTQGACQLRDTAVISFGGQTTFPVTPDQTICGTSFTPTSYQTGCGGTLSATEISGPTAATISYAYSSGTAASSTNTTVTYSGLIVGTYTFATQVLGCTGAVSRDTFVITIASTLGVTNAGVQSKDLCFDNFDTAYYFSPTVSLLPGETLTWNPTIISKTPGSLPTPTATIIGNTLKLTGVTHPDTFATSGSFQYRYQYTVSNGLCSRVQNINLTLRTPSKKTIFQTVVNQPCNIDTAIINNFISGPPALSFDQVTVLTKPATAPAPFIAIVSGKIVASDLSAGKYTFSFRYTQGSCDFNTQVVDVYISKFTGLANAGTDQKLPCGTTNTTLAGNIPSTGETGTWQQVSGPSVAALTTPNNPSLPVSGLVIGTYVFRWSIAGGSGCMANVDDVHLTVADATIANAGPDDTVCAGGLITLNGGTLFFGDSGRWKQISGPPVTLSDSTTQYTTFFGAASDTVYTFSFTVRNVCDTSRDTVSVTTNAIAGPSRAIILTSDTCLTASSSLNLVATTPTSGAGTWTQFSGPSVATIGSPSTTTTSVSGLIPGTYNFIWTVASGSCSDQTDTVRVSYSPSALVSNAGTDQNVCNATSITLGATATSPSGIIGTWSQITGPGSVISAPNSPTSSVTGIVAGNAYDYIWTVSAGAQSVCPAKKDTVHIIISTQPSPAVAMADVLACGSSGGSVAITATAPTSGNGFWSVLQSPAGFSTSFGNAALNNTTVNLSGGTTKIIWQVNSGYGGACPTNYDTVTFEAIPTVNAGTDQSLCNSATTIVTGSAYGTGSVVWTQVSGPSTVTFNQPNSRSTTISGMINGVYQFRYTLTHPSCGGNDNIIVTNYGVPIANAGADFSVCWVPPSAIIPLVADTVGTPGAATVTWSRTLGNGTVSYSPSTTAASTNATVTNFGIQQFLLTVANPGCTSKDYIDVFVDKPTILGFTLTPRSACNDSFAITASVPVDGYTYLWEFPTGTTPSVTGVNLRGPIPNRFTVLGNNKVYLTLTNTTSGCTSKDSTTIFVCKSVIPPIANNITAVRMNSINAALAIPELKASNPSGTDIREYKVLTLPSASQGILYYCTSATTPCPGGSLSLVTTSTPLTLAQARRLYFDPNQNFTGNVTFTYNATDTNDLLSNTATYTIPVFNNPPVTQNIRTAVLTNNSTDIFIPRLISGDPDGTVDSFYIGSVPSSSLGVLKYCSNGTAPCTGSLISITGNKTLSAAQGKTLVFDPFNTYVGDFVFEYQSKDNNGNLSNVSTYTIPVVNYDYYTLFTYPLDKVPPVSDNITSQYINNSSASTPIPNLNGNDPDGTTVFYTIGSNVPNTSTQGTLSYCASPGPGCILSPVLPNQTMSIAQASTLQFDPVPSFVGIATFTYTSTDADAVPKTSPLATYKIPVVNMPPVANPGSITPVSNTKTTPTLLPPLYGYDVDGTVVSYSIVDVPPFSQGILKYCALAPALCTPSTLSTITAAITGLTAAQIATINFTPNQLYTGDYIFHFRTVDNNGQQSQPAAFTIPVIAFNLTTGEPPIAVSFNNPTINNNSSALLSTALTGSDPDGTVDSFIIRSITPANEGVLTYCTTPPLIGCGTAVYSGLVLTPSQAQTITFKPDTNFTGVATFNYVDKDNAGNISNTATVTIPVVNLPPVSNNVNNLAISRLGGLPSTLNPLSSTDVDGSVKSYKINTIPTPEEGVLKLCVTPPSTGCTNVAIDQVLLPADIGKLTFTPNSLNHSPVVTFLYSSIDNIGNISNLATVNIPFFDAFPLPINLISFEATKKNHSALLNWVIGVEAIGMGYELEYSINGINWVLINKQSSSSKSTTKNDYVYLHNETVVGNNYYRLKIVDQERKLYYSPVRIVNFDNSNDYSITLYPNPVTDNFTVSTSDGSAMSEVSIYSNEGKLIQQFTQVISGSVISINNYSSGFYIIKIKDKNGEMQTMKLTKK
jgi:hypothetical protein